MEIKNKKTQTHKSLGTKITETRLKLINSLYGSNMNIKYTDLNDENGIANGTRVEISFPVNFYPSDRSKRKDGNTNLK